MRVFGKLSATFGAIMLAAALAVPSAWAASGWTTSIAPTAGNRTSAPVADIACPTATLCVGVDQGRPQGFVIDNGVATARALPLPIDAAGPQSAGLAAIACSSATSCVAVGAYDTYTDRQRPLFETYTAGTWQASSAATSAQRLSDVACNARSCLATGEWYGDPYDYTALLKRTASGTWVDSGLEANYGDTIAEPTCTPGTGPCFAQVFHQYYGFPDPRMFAYRSGAKWTTTTFPGSADADLTTLQLGTMACPSTSYCVGVGSYFDDTRPSQQHLIAETYQHGTLSYDELPMPAAFADETDPFIPGNTACAGTGRCVAGGFFRNDETYKSHDGLVFAKSGTTWTVQTTPVPSGRSASAAWVTTADCARGAGMCAVVGRSGSSALAEVYSGTTWHPSVLTLPSGHTSGQLSEVSCPTTACTAGGSSNGDPLLAVRG